MASVRNQGRLAGLIYLGVVLTGIFTLAYVPSILFKNGNPSMVLDTLEKNQGLFRAGIIASLFMIMFYLALPFALARFLHHYGRWLTWAMILSVALAIPLMLLSVAYHMELARLVASNDASEPDVVRLLTGHDRWRHVATIFWGLWLAPFGWLTIRSRAIPRIFGTLLLFGCAGYLLNFAGPSFIQDYNNLPWQNYVSRPGSLGEIGTCLWLIIFGARAVPIANRKL